MARGPLKRFRIQNHKGILEFAVAPDGKSIRLEGANGSGKTSILDGIAWIVSPDGSDAGMRNGAEFRAGEMVFGEYLFTRRQKRGGKPSSNMPAAALEEVRAALTRKPFSALSDAEQIATVKRLAPGLDTSRLEAQEKRLYEERTLVNRDAKALRAQADGVRVPDAVAVVGEERPVVDVVDVAAVAAKKGEVERVRAENAEARRVAAEAARRASALELAVHNAVLEVRRLERALAEQREIAERVGVEQEAAAAEAVRTRHAAQALVDPDTSAIDAEIQAARDRNAAARAETEAHNRAARAAQRTAEDRQRALAERERLAKTAAAKEAEAHALTERLEATAAERERTIAEAAKSLPLPLAIVDGAVVYDGVALRDLNTAARIKVDIAIAAAQGIKLMPVRDASLLDDNGRREVEQMAADHGMQLISEIVKTGAPLTAIIEDEPSDQPDLW